VSKVIQPTNLALNNGFEMGSTIYWTVYTNASSTSSFVRQGGGVTGNYAGSFTINGNPGLNFFGFATDTLSPAAGSPAAYRVSAYYKLSTTSGCSNVVSLGDGTFTNIYNSNPSETGYLYYFEYISAVVSSSVFDASHISIGFVTVCTTNPGFLQFIVDDMKITPIYV
jgi:hypothetical protein